MEAAAVVAGPACSRIGLSLTASYAPSWGVWEGLRELVQNWHDGLLASSETAGPELARAPLEFLPSLRSSSCLAQSEPQGGDGNTEARGCLRFEARRGGHAVGWCEYMPEERRLLLVNHGVGLGRQVLLLGYSKKAQHQDVIGSFGEGLKVGAVALLRRGLSLRMLTREESWGFELAVDPAFGEKVLTVQVGTRSQFQANESEKLVEEEQSGWLESLRELQTEDTASLLQGLREEEWRQLSQRFLFLSPPAESVRTQVGRLLLDARHAGSFYVRGVWINDDPDLSAGVDLFDIRLDRDRAAVLRKSDLEHQVSSMWVRAVKFDPTLQQRYFELLSSEEKRSDVAFAELYCDDELCEVVVAEFTGRFGGSIPVSIKDANSSKVATLKSAFNESTTVVTNALLAILRKGGVKCDLDDLLREGEAKARKRVPLAALSEEEAVCLAEAVRLAERALDLPSDGDSLSSRVDIVECVGCLSLDSILKVKAEECFDTTGRLEIDRRALTHSAVHEMLPSGQCMGGVGRDLGKPCWCAPAILSQSMYAAHSSRKPFGMERVIAGLADRAFQSVGTSTPPPLRCPQLGEEREAALLRQIDALEGLLQGERTSHADALKSLQRRVSEAEKELSRTEWKILDAQAAEQKVRDELGAELTRLRAEAANTHRAQILMEQQKEASEAAVRESQHLRQRLESLEHQASVSEEASRRSLEATEAREARLRQALARRRQLVQKMVRDDPASPLISLVDGDELQAAVEEIRTALREEAQQRQCCVCADGPADALLLPCRHQQLCTTCAGALSSCPVCRARIESRMHVFVS